MHCIYCVGNRRFEAMKALPAWLYKDPLAIIDGQRAIAARQARKRAVEPVRKPKDRYYTQARSIHISALVAWRVKNGGTWVK